MSSLRLTFRLQVEDPFETADDSLDAVWWPLSRFVEGDRVDAELVNFVLGEERYDVPAGLFFEVDGKPWGYAASSSMQPVTVADLGTAAKWFLAAVRLLADPKQPEQQVEYSGRFRIQYQSNGKLYFTGKTNTRGVTLRPFKVSIERFAAELSREGELCRKVATALAGTRHHRVRKRLFDLWRYTQIFERARNPQTPLLTAVIRLYLPDRSGKVDYDRYVFEEDWLPIASFVRGDRVDVQRLSRRLTRASIGEEPHGGFLFDVRGIPWGYDPCVTCGPTTFDYLGYAAHWTEALLKISGSAKQADVSIYGTIFRLKRSGAQQVKLTKVGYLGDPKNNDPTDPLFSPSPVTVQLDDLKRQMVSQAQVFVQVMQAMHKSGHQQFCRALEPMQQHLKKLKGRD